MSVKKIGSIPLEPRNDRQRRMQERMLDLLRMGMNPGTVSRIMCKKIINKEEI